MPYLYDATSIWAILINKTLERNEDPRNGTYLFHLAQGIETDGECRLYLCLSVPVFGILSFLVSVCMSVCVPLFNLSVSLCLSLSLFVSVSLCLCLSVSVSLSLSLSLSLCLCLSLRLSLSVCFSPLLSVPSSFHMPLVLCFSSLTLDIYCCIFTFSTALVYAHNNL